MRTSLLSGPLKTVCSHCFRLFVAVFLIPLFVSSAVQANEDLFAGFDEDPPTLPEVHGVDQNPVFNHFSGYMRLLSVFTFAHKAQDSQETDWRGLSALRTELLLETQFRRNDWQIFGSAKASHDFVFAINGREHYTSQLLASYENDIELREAFIQGALSDNIDLKLGRQIIVWGRSEHFRVTDILNPLDMREPGLTDLEDLRLPTTMTALDYYMEKWRLSVVAGHEHRSSKTPPYGSDFYPSSSPPLSEVKPKSSPGNTDLAMELQGVFPGWDISFYGAYLYNQQSTIVPQNPAYMERSKITMVGSAFTMVRGGSLFFLEAAHLRGLQFSYDYGTDYARTDVLVGVEYQGISDTSIGLEAVSRYLHNYNHKLSGSPENPHENTMESGLHFSHSLYDDRITIESLLMIMGKRGENGSLLRVSATYDFADNWQFNSGLVLYWSGQRVDYGDNDRIFLGLRYDF